jgi:transmembrane 9 superfamily protein 2/4
MVYPRIDGDVVYTYDVVFYESKLKWTSRWDHLLESSKDDNIHWFSFINSTLVILIFAALLGHIFFRALKRDIDYINSVKIFTIFKNNFFKKQFKNYFREQSQMMFSMIVAGSKSAMMSSGNPDTPCCFLF